MSIEKRTDKLDLKLSSLIRNMGLITTLTFGLLALIINYSLTNFLINLIILGLAVSLLGNIVYILIIFYFTSSRKDDFIYELNTYKQLNDITSELYKEHRSNFFKLGANFEKNFRALNYSRDSIERLREEVRELLAVMNAELPQGDELPYYKIKCKSVTELSNKIQAVLAFIYNHVILEHASYLDQEIEEQPTDEQKRVKSFIDESYLFYEIVSKYCLDLNSYEELELSDINIRNLILLNPYYLCNYLIEISKRSIYGKYIEISSKKSEIVHNYSKNVKRPYCIYIISLVVFGILMLYFAISMFF